MKLGLILLIDIRVLLLVLYFIIETEYITKIYIYKIPLNISVLARS